MPFPTMYGGVYLLYDRSRSTDALLGQTFPCEKYHFQNFKLKNDLNKMGARWST